MTALSDPAPRGTDGPSGETLGGPRPTAGIELRWLAEDSEGDGVRRRRFDVLHGGRSAPGLLWTPANETAPWPIVLLGHGGSGSKGQGYIRAMGRRLAREHTLAAAAIDGPVHGDRRVGPAAPTSLVLAEFAQRWAGDGDTMTDEMVADWRATLSALQALPDISTGPAGWWGLSMGTILGLPVVAADDRIGAAVLGLMGLTGPTRARIERDAATIGCPVLFLVQWDDLWFPPPVALALWEALATDDKRLLAHPGGHGDVPAEGFEVSARFLADRLVPQPKDAPVPPIRRA
jgi:dienelactone hydrolase